MARSYLFVPGDQPDKIARSFELGADALIFDLEDAVIPDRKEKARESVATTLARDSGGCELWVRINNHADLVADDVAAAVSMATTGVVVPKVVGAGGLAKIVEIVHRREAAVGLASGTVVLMAMIEDGAGILAMEEIATAPMVRTMMIGEYDMAMELGIKPSPDGREFLFAHSKLVAVCSAAGLDPPVAPVSKDFRDGDMFRASTVRFARMGYRSRALIHPNQVQIANDVFTPTEAETIEAREIIDRYEAGKALGKGAVVGEDGALIDEPIVRAARRVIDAARLISGE